MDKFVGICCGGARGIASGYNRPLIEKCSECGKENFGSFYWQPSEEDRAREAALDARIAAQYAGRGLDAVERDIVEIDLDCNPFGVAAHIRCEIGPLDALSPQRLAHEVRIAVESEKVYPGIQRACALAYGGAVAAQRYDEWETAR